MNKLCLIIPSLSAGGMERVMSELAAYFCQKQDSEIHLVMYGINQEVFYKVPSNLIIHKPSFKFENRLRMFYSIKTLVYLRKEIKQIKPNSILSFGEYWNSFVLLAVFGLKYPVFISDRCQPDKSLGWIHDALRKFLYPHAAGVIVQTQIAKKIYEQLLPKSKVTVIGNPIRQIVCDEETKRQNIVLSVGRLIESKHHEELIRLFTQINLPDWKLILIGDDAIRQKNGAKLEALIKELNAENKVNLLGSQKDVDFFYQKSKIFAFTSSSEGFPNVIGEAMSAGLPVVAFDCIAGPSEMIEDGSTGFLIPLFDYNTFKDRIKMLMLNEQLQQSQGFNGQKKIADFSPEIICEKYYQILLPGI